MLLTSLEHLVYYKILWKYEGQARGEENRKDPPLSMEILNKFIQLKDNKKLCLK